ncbi:MAG: ComF family protein [Clostridia bacterium]|nr:ComF family protein [Clostridia bacterium]
MCFKDFIVKILTKGFYDPTWRCNGCGKEMFGDRFFCEECEKHLPYNDKIVCEHCGRAIKSPSAYCSTCKEILLSVDKARSAFNYDKPISGLIKKAKYDNGRYILDYFATKLANLYFAEFASSEVVCCVPMSKKRLKKRGYNQSELLAKKVAEIINVPFSDCVAKNKETARQAKLKRSKRLKNLTDSFQIKDKNAVRGKNILLIDDVTTTGATAEAVAVKLKKAGALRVHMITVASVPSKDGY